MKLRVFALCMLMFVTILMAACSLLIQDVNQANSNPVATVDVELMQLIQNQLNATPLPKPSLETGGFFYYESEAPAGFDPIFAVCNGQALQLTREGDGWKADIVGMDMVQALQLNDTGQRSDYMRYMYIPRLGEIHLLDDRGIPHRVINFGGEYNPEYWIWAWNSLMFIKNCNLTVFSVSISGTSKYQRFKF